MIGWSTQFVIDSHKQHVHCCLGNDARFVSTILTDNVGLYFKHVTKLASEMHEILDNFLVFHRPSSGTTVLKW